MNRTALAKQLVKLAKQLTAAKSLQDWYQGVEPETMETSSIDNALMKSLAVEAKKALERKWKVHRETKGKHQWTFGVTTPGGPVVLELKILDAYEAPKAVDMGIALSIPNKVKIEVDKVFRAKNTEDDIIKWVMDFVQSELRDHKMASSRQAKLSRKHYGEIADKLLSAIQAAARAEVFSAAMDPPTARELVGIQKELEAIHKKVKALT